MNMRITEQEWITDDICHWNTKIRSKLIGYNSFGRHVSITIEEDADNSITKLLRLNTDIEVELSFTTKQTHTLQ